MTPAVSLHADATREIGRRIVDAAASGRRLRLIGHGGWLDAGRPVVADETLDLSPLTGIGEYTPGDFTITAGAGTPLSDLDAITADHGQWLPLDPYGPRTGTLGATLATASEGPLAASIGAPRDVTLGLAVVTGEGKLIHGGGRVVKNVAGFDLVRLNIGAWGTLGAITEATLRVRARPAVDRTLSLQLGKRPVDLDRLVRELRQSPIQPLAAEILSPAMARHLGLTTGTVVLVRLAGNRTAVATQLDTLRRMGPLDDAPLDAWRQLAVCEPAYARVLTAAVRPSELTALWVHLITLLGPSEPLLQATIDRGRIRIMLPTSMDAALDALYRTPPSGATLRGERLPRTLWDLRRTRPTDAIARRLQRAFDPQGVLNAGLVLGPA